jgi:hypothetical protein
MKIYIAGPMTGLPKNNFPAFDAATALLKDLGHWPISPADLDRCFGHDANKLDDSIRRDIEAIMQSDAVYMLCGWEKSTGAKAEHALAVWRGMAILYQSTAEVQPCVTTE